MRLTEVAEEDRREGHVRPLHHTVAGDAAEGARQLDRRDRHRTLSDADGNGLACVPLLLEVLDLPLFRGHHARDLVGQIDVRLLSKAEDARVFRNASDTEAIGECIEVRVTGLVDRFADIDDPVRGVLRSDPALEEASVEDFAAAAVHVRAFARCLPAGRRSP